MEQLLIHAVGDYFLQNDWMALNKKNKNIEGFIACAIHSILYTIPFILISCSWKALLVILFSHFLIDRTNIVAYFIAVKNEFMDYLFCGKLYEPDNKYTYLNEKILNFGFHPTRPFVISI